MDHFSPVAGAHIRVLVLPVGSIEHGRFARFVQRLQNEASLIALADVEQRSDDNGSLLSPKAFPQGSLLYRYSSAAPSEQQQQLSPYELFREPLLVIGVVVGLDTGDEARRTDIDSATAYLKERHPRVVHRQLVILEQGDRQTAPDTSNVIPVYNAGEQNTPSLRAAVCELSARFLVELSTYAKAVNASPTIATPGQTARSLQRTVSLRDEDKRSSSGVSSPPDEGSPSRAPSKAPPLPATSFDQIAGASSVQSGLARSDSRASSSSGKGKGHGRTSSQDRVSVQGFGSSTSQEKARIRGKARVGIVSGSIYLMAGHWSEALRILVEHTSKSRSLSDHLWHARGLEQLMVCMLLLAWAGVEFQVPSICDPVAERTGSSTRGRPGIDARLAAEGMQRQTFRLSVAIPDLAKLILSLYRYTEGSLELPAILPAEASVRVARLLATLSRVGELTQTSLRPLIFAHHDASNALGRPKAAAPQLFVLAKSSSLSKSAIADILAQALPSNDMVAGDVIRLLAGIASTYSILNLDRKKAITIKDLVARLTQALIQARKLGAAEMGIHPAAALSVESGAEGLLPAAAESSGIGDLMGDLATVYGAAVIPATRDVSPTYVQSKHFGNQLLQRDLLRELASFCEASPDPHGVLALTASLLRAAGPNAAVDLGSEDVSNAFAREEQMHYGTVISRTVAVSRHLGLTDVQAVYWDPFLIRDLMIVQPVGPRAVIDRTKINVAPKAADQPLGPGNPLLYDPAASRPGTAAKPTYLMIRNEPSECLITLQNPFDIPVDIEELELVSEGVTFASQHQPTTLGPLRFQQVALLVTPSAVGSAKIIGCRIKMQGCYAQVFPIVTPAWSARSPLTIKDIGLTGRRQEQLAAAEPDLKQLGIEPETISATVIDEVPLLALENTEALESGLMLLEGESRSLELVLRNIGSISATVFEATDTSDVLRRDDEHKLKLRGVKHKRSKSFLPTTTVEPGECLTFRFRVEGKAGLSSTHANFYYQAGGSDQSKHARVVSVPVIMTVNAALQVQHLDITQPDEGNAGRLIVSFDIRNAWPRSVLYECFEKAARRLEWRRGSADVAQNIQDGQLAPGEIRRIYLNIQHNTEAEYEEDADTVRLRFLDQLHISWRVDEHSGYVDLTSLSLSAEAIDLVRGAPVSVVLTVDGQDSSKAHEVQIGGFVSIAARLTNRASGVGPLYVQLSPQASATGRDDRRFTITGTMRRVLKPLEKSGKAQVEFALCPVLAGSIDLDMIVRPAQMGGEENKGRWNSRCSLSLLAKRSS